MAFTATAGNEGNKEAPGSPERPTVRKLARPASWGSKSLLGAASSLGRGGGSGGGGQEGGGGEERHIVPYDQGALLLREEAARTAPVRFPEP